jgi:hypothetical protein
MQQSQQVHAGFRFVGDVRGMCQRYITKLPRLQRSALDRSLKINKGQSPLSVSTLSMKPVIITFLSHISA